MSYKLDYSVKPNPMIPWYCVFYSLSLPHFSDVYEVFDFPYSPPEDLRTIAHDFALTADLLTNDPEYALARQAILGDPIASKLSSDLLSDKQSHDSYLQKRHTLFENTFLRLDQLGYAASVYKLGRESHIYLKYANRPRYISLCNLEDWGQLLGEAMPNGSSSKSSPPPLSETQLMKLQTLIQEYALKEQSFRNKWNELMLLPRTLWEDYVLRRGGARTWISVEGTDKIRLRKWIAILNTLTLDEVRLLEQWGLQNNSSRHRIEVPMPDPRISNF